MNKNTSLRLGHSLILNSQWSLGLEQNECKRVEMIIPYFVSHSLILVKM